MFYYGYGVYCIKIYKVLSDVCYAALVSLKNALNFLLASAGLYDRPVNRITTTNNTARNMEGKAKYKIWTTPNAISTAIYLVEIFALISYI